MATASKPALTVSLEPAPNAGEAVGLLAQAQTLIVTDKPSHTLCLETLKGAKALKRSIEDHYAAIKRPLNDARATVLQMEKDHLAQVEQAIATLERTATTYTREQERRERDAADVARREAEAKEQARRDADAADAEAAALKLEASSTVLSERETVFVALVVTSNKSIPALIHAAKKAGYKDPEGAVSRLMKSAKINTAIANADKAAAIRRESQAKQAAPIIVETVAQESQIGKVAGTSMRTYYGCGDVNMEALVRAVLAGKCEWSAIQPNMVFLNEQARSLKEQFPKVYLMCELTKRDGVTG